MIVGIDAKRIVRNGTGLGSYGRTLVNDLIRLGDSGVTVVTRSWCKGPDYWEVYFNLNETVYQMLKERGFMFPFNRVDVNILNNN